MKTRTLLERTVGEIMQTDVTSVDPGISVRDLTQVLSDEGISGAPVVTPDGRVVGVVSNSDVIRLTAESPDAIPVTLRGGSESPWVPRDDEPPEPVYGDYFLPEEGPHLVPSLGDDVGGGPADDMSVEDIMSPVPFTVEPGTTVRELAVFLTQGRIHRALVTEDEHLVGIVTATDILRAIADEA